MSRRKRQSVSPLYQRGLVAKSGFVLFVLAPSVALSVFAWWICVASGKPVLAAAGTTILCAIIVDYVAYHVFSHAAVEPAGLVYAGGGVLWKRVRKCKIFSWNDYVYLVRATRNGYYISVQVLGKRKRQLLWLPARVSAYPEYSAFVREILIRNPSVKMVFKGRVRPGRRPALSRREHGIALSGDSEFVRCTTEALELIRRHDHVNYRRVREYVRKIQCGQCDSGMNLETATFEVSKSSALERDATLYASTIVHEMCHCMLHSRFRFSWYNPLNRREHEEICCKAQLRSLKRVGGSEGQLEYLQKEFKRRLSTDHAKRCNGSSDGHP